VQSIDHHRSVWFHSKAYTLPVPLSPLHFPACVADDDDLEEELDESTRQFNFWTHQIHIFFVRKFLPAAENMIRLKHAVHRRMQVRWWCGYMGQEEVVWSFAWLWTIKFNLYSIIILWCSFLKDLFNKGKANLNAAQALSLNIKKYLSFNQILFFVSHLLTKIVKGIQ